MGAAQWKRAGQVVVTCAVLIGCATAYGASDPLPAVVAGALKKAFPNATITSVDRETENGVRYYEVNLLLNGERIEVEVDAFGGIGEIERRISIDEAPAELVEALAAAIKGGGRIRIERHERWGTARGGRFVQLAEPRVFYEIKWYSDEGTRTAQWRPKAGADLPEKVAAAIMAAFPGAVITEVEKEREGGIDLFEVELIHNGQDMEVEVSTCGVLMEVETDVSAKELPSAVLDTITKASEGGTITSVERAEIRALVKDGKLVTLDPPEVVYEAELRKDDKEAEVEVAEDGTLLEEPEWKIGDEEDEDDEDDEDDDEDDEEDDD